MGLYLSLSQAGEESAEFSFQVIDPGDDLGLRSYPRLNEPLLSAPVPGRFDALRIPHIPIAGGTAL